MKNLRQIVTVLTLVLASVSVGAPHVASAVDARTWAAADEAAIHPGVQTRTASADAETDGGGQCTANFIFTRGGDVLIGQAAHCAGTGAATDVDGCDAGSLPLGTPVQVEGASQPGTLVYSSWLTMQANGESDEDACRYNDFALVRLHPDDHDEVNPSLPVYGGPVGPADGSQPGEKVYTYGNSSLRAGIEVLSPKEGYSLGEDGDGWSHTVYTVTPGIPGDSGSPVLDSSGGALGVLVTVALAPLAGSNGVTDLQHAVDYARAHDAELADLALVHGTEPFAPGIAP